MLDRCPPKMMVVEPWEPSNAMLTATELKVALDMASAQVTALGRQLEEATDREAKEAADAKVGSW